MINTIKKICCLLILLEPLMGTSQNWKTVGEQDSIPLPIYLTHGKLSNGLAYYIYKDPSIEQDKIMMSLMVKTGFFNELENQYQFSHLIEHIPFLETPAFPDGIKSFRKFDMVPLVDASASTANPYTKYWFNYPKNKPEAFKEGLKWFHEIAGNLQFTDQITEQIKSEVQGETLFRTSSSIHSYRLDNEIYIGSKIDHDNSYKFLKTCCAKNLLAFYSKWYTPENMGIFVIGNIESEESEVIARIDETFSHLKASTDDVIKVNLDEAYMNTEPQFVKVDAKELINAPELKLYFRNTLKTNLLSRQDYEDFITQEVIYSLIKKRFLENARTYDSSASSVYIQGERFPPSMVIHYKLLHTAGIQKELQKTILELNRMGNYGFSPSELKEAITEVRKKYIKKEDNDPKVILDKCYSHFLEGKVILDNEKAMIQYILEQLDKDEVEKMFVQLFHPKTAIDVVLLASDNNSWTIEKKQVFKWIDEAWNIKIKESLPVAITPIKELKAKDTLSNVSNDKDYKVTTIPELGITEISLANGIQIVLKSFQPQGLASEKILVNAFKPGGAGLYTGNDFFPALYAADIIRHSGVNGFDKFELDRYTKAKKMSVTPFINMDESGIRAESSPEDLETLLQLLNFYMTKPNKNESAFSDWKLRISSTIGKPLDARQRVKDSLDRVIGDISMNVVPANEDIETITLDKTYGIYKELFLDPKNFTFIFTGNFDVAKTTILIANYLGTIPKWAGDKKNPEPDNFGFPKGPKYYNLKDNVSKEAFVRLCYAGEFMYNRKEDTGLYFLCLLLNDRLNRRLRTNEPNSTVYVVFAAYNLYRANGAYRIDILYNCEKEQAKRLIDAVREEIALLKEKGPQQVEMENVLNDLNLYFFPDMEKNNRLVIRDLKSMYRNKAKERIPIIYIKEEFKEISKQDIKDLANKYLTEENYFQFILKGIDKS